MLFWQGEADARALVPQADYEEALRTLAASVADDLGVPLVAAQIGDYDVRYTAEGVNGIRLAQQDVWGRGDVVAGPVLYDIDLHGRVHFTQPSELEAAALRWTAAVLAGVGRLDVPVGPRLLEAAYDEWLTVGLTFDVAGGELRPGRVGGLKLRTADGDPVAYQYAAVTGPDSVSVYLFSPVDGASGGLPGQRPRRSRRERARRRARTGSCPALPFVDVGVAAARPDDELRDVAAPTVAVASAPPVSPR